MLNNIEIVYDNVRQQIGNPKEYSDFVNDGYLNNEGFTEIPKHVLSANGIAPSN